MRQNTAIATRIYNALLYLYPADFREAYGAAMTCIFEESLSDAFAQSGPAGALKLGLHTLSDLATAALAEWASRFMVNLGIEQRTSLGVSIAINIVLFSLILIGVKGGGLHPRPSVTPVCGEVSTSHFSSSAHR
jgi:hypothetical protein